VQTTDGAAMIEFKTLRSPYADQKLWGATVGAFTFVIMRDQDEQFYTVSIKSVGAKKFDGSRHDLGEFDSFTEAREACEDFLTQYPQARKND
jgi:hypothetical protein